MCEILYLNPPASSVSSITSCEEKFNDKDSAARLRSILVDFFAKIEEKMWKKSLLCLCSFLIKLWRGLRKWEKNSRKVSLYLQSGQWEMWNVENNGFIINDRLQQSDLMQSADSRSFVDFFIHNWIHYDQ